MATPHQKRDGALLVKKQSSNTISISLIGIFFKNFLQFFVLFLDLHFDLFYLRCTLHLSSFGNQIFFIWQAVFALHILHICLKSKRRAATCGISPIQSHTFYVFRARETHPNRPLSRGFFRVEKHPLLLYP